MRLSASCKVVVLLTGYLFTGCAAYATQTRDVEIASPPKEPPALSLIASDAQAISDAEIHRILATQPTLPPRVRIAIVHLRHDSMSYRVAAGSTEFISAMSPAFVSALHGSPMVADASYLPAFLFSTSPSIAQLREAAARYQADVVLLFTTSCSLYPEYNLFSSNEVRAYCAADSAMLDVRTGLVPFVSRAREDFTMRASSKDHGLAETVQRTELAGIDKAMKTNADALVAFLGRVQRSQRAAVTSPAAPAE